MTENYIVTYYNHHTQGAYITDLDGAKKYIQYLKRQKSNGIPVYTNIQIKKQED
jgi:hypothetical protein